MALSLFLQTSCLLAVGVNCSDGIQIPAVSSRALKEKDYLENIFFRLSADSLSVMRLQVQERWSLCGPPAHVTQGHGDEVRDGERRSMTSPLLVPSCRSDRPCSAVWLKWAKNKQSTERLGWHVWLLVFLFFRGYRLRLVFLLLMAKVSLITTW